MSADFDLKHRHELLVEKRKALQRQSWRSGKGEMLGLGDDSASAALLDELAALTERVRQEMMNKQAALNKERAALKAEAERLEAIVAERRWEIAKEQHSLDMQKQTIEDTQNEAAKVASASSDPVLLEASGAEFETTVATLTTSEPGSTLAAVVQRALRSRALRAMDGGWEPSNEELRVVVDRDASITHYVVEWLRRGESALEGVPEPLLRRLQLEARHWRLAKLDEACERHCGGAEADAMHLRWLTAQLLEHRESALVCKTVTAELWEWLVASHARRELAVTETSDAVLALERGRGAPPRRPRELLPRILSSGVRVLPSASHRAAGVAKQGGVLDALMKVMQANFAAEPEIVRAGFGCCAALGAGSLRAREALREYESTLQACPY